MSRHLKRDISCTSKLVGATSRGLNQVLLLFFLLGEAEIVRFCWLINQQPLLHIGIVRLPKDRLLPERSAENRGVIRAEKRGWP